MTRKRLLIALAILTVAVLAAIGAAPWAYQTYVEGPPQAPPALTPEVRPATTGVDGTWTIQPGSQAGYRVQQRLFWELIDVTGRTDAVSGEVEVAAGQLVSADFTIDVADITSGRDGRDEKFRSGDAMEVDAFPTAMVRIEAPVDVAAVPADGTSRRLDIPVALTLKGVTRSVIAQSEIRRSADQVEVAGTVPIRFAEFGVDPPKPFASILAVQPNATIEFRLHLAKR